MPRLARHALTIVLALAALAPAAAQQTSVDLDPVDMTIEDLSALSMSLREIEPGLQQPNGFARVFRVKGGDDLYRQQGGLYAVFPESRYSINKEGQLLPMIPPDTVFYIGRPSVLDPELPEAGAAPERLVRHRIDARVAPPREDAGPRRASRLSHVRRAPLEARSTPACPAPLPPIVADEAYRTQRLHDLLRYAARGRSSSSK
jgi:hypothetical protein